MDNDEMNKCPMCKKKLSMNHQKEFYSKSILEIYRIKCLYRLTNIQLCELMGISKRTLYRYFNPQGSMLDVKTSYMELLKLKLNIK